MYVTDNFLAIALELVKRIEGSRFFIILDFEDIVIIHTGA